MRDRNPHTPPHLHIWIVFPNWKRFQGWKKKGLNTRSEPVDVESKIKRNVNPVIPEFLRYECPFCKNAIEYPVQLNGTLAICPHCGQDIEFPRLFVSTDPPVIDSKFSSARRVPSWIGWTSSIAGILIGLLIPAPFIAALLVIAFYFTPTVCAAFRGNRNLGPIFLINLTLGWTILGWLVAFCWAFVPNPTDPKSRSSKKRW